MLILAIDSSGRQGSLAVLRDESVLAATGGVSDEPYASRLFTDLRTVLDGSQVKLEQIELLAVATGPGSFTGLRVGLTAVKAWAEVFGRPIAAVSGLEAVAAQAGATDRLLVPVMDARGGKFFGAIFRCQEKPASHLQLMGEEVVLTTQEFFPWVARETGGAPTLFLSPVVAVVGSALAGSLLAGAPLQEVSGDLAPFIGRLGYARALRGQLMDPLSLEANYVRRSDAEVNWRGA